MAKIRSIPEETLAAAAKSRRAVGIGSTILQVPVDGVMGFHRVKERSRVIVPPRA